MRRPLTLPILLLLAASAMAAPIVLTVGGEGWFALAARSFPPSADLNGGAPASEGKITLSKVESGQKIYVFHRDRNLGLFGTSDSFGKNPISPEKATHLLKVLVNVIDGFGADGKPKPYAGEASVEFLDGDRSQTELTSNGLVVFNWVRIGPATITVKSRGADNKTRVATQQVTIERDGLSGFIAPVSSDATAAPNPNASGASPASGAAPNPASSGAAGGSILGNILSTLIGLGLVGGLGYAGWRYVKANPDKASEMLTKIGADVPKPLDADDPPQVTPASTSAPAVPSGPIILDPAPEPIQVSAAPISLSAASTGVPKLIGSDGSAFELPEGETVVGREALGGLMIGHDTVSRRHARLVRSGASVTVEDLGSTNGTWVNDAPTPASLQGGETVRFGQVSYRFEA